MSIILFDLHFVQKMKMLKKQGKIQKNKNGKKVKIKKLKIEIVFFIF